jgi:hypothetical protein
VIVYLALACIPVVLWLAMEFDSRRNRAREIARRSKGRKGYLL